MLACGEREAMVMAPPPMRDSAVTPSFHDCLAFLHRHFSSQSPPSPPLNLSLCSQQQPSPWAHSPNSSSQPSCAFQGTCVPVQGMYGCSKDCLVLIPFRLPQTSCYPLSLKCFSSDLDNCSDVGTNSCFGSPTLLEQVQSY